MVGTMVIYLNLTNMEKRTFSEIAAEIKKLWPKPYFGAVPYIQALYKCDTIDPKSYFYFDETGMIINYLLANMQTFRGPDARRIKAELKNML